MLNAKLKKQPVHTLPAMSLASRLDMMVLTLEAHDTTEAIPLKVQIPAVALLCSSGEDLVAVRWIKFTLR